MKDIYETQEHARFGEHAKRWHSSARAITERLRGVRAWVAVFIAALNYMHAGMLLCPQLSTLWQGPPSSTQLEVITRLHLYADDLLGEKSKKFGGKDWASEMNAMKMDYDGASVGKVMDLTLEQVIPGSPVGVIRCVFPAWCALLCASLNAGLARFTVALGTRHCM